MSILFLTVFLTTLLAMLFVLFFVYNLRYQRHRGLEQQALLPLHDDDGARPTDTEAKDSTTQQSEAESISSANTHH